MAIDINIPSQVKNYANLAGFPVTGTLKTIFIAEDTNKTYRWTGSAYVEISATAASTWGAIGGTLSNQTDLQTALNAKVTGNTAITGATKTKVTYDSKGLVTAGADATTADIADSTNKRYVTDANLTTIGNTSGTNTGDQTLSGLGGVPTSRTLTINGTTQDLSADRTFTISTGITIGTTAITSGTVGRVLFEGTGNVVSESANLFFDNTNGRLGIGTSSPSAFLDVKGNTIFGTGNAVSVGSDQVLTLRSSTTTSRFYLQNSGTGTNALSGVSFDLSNSIFEITNRQALGTIAFITNGAERLRIGTTGNVLINTTTDAGFKLDVNGTARVNTLTIGLGTGQIATNVVVGYQGLFSNTTGLQNIAIGYQAVYTNSTGSGNVGVGVSSLVFNSTGSGNTAFGDESLLRNTTGARNIGIGQRAGTYAGSGTANNQTSSDSIYIGYQARASASGATNELVFGKDTVGAGNNSVVLGNTSITKTILRGTLNALGLPTSPAGLSSGDIWNNLGILTIV